MATRVPLIVDTSTLYIKELPVGDSLDLSGSGLTQITAIGATTGNFSGIVTASSFYVDSNVVLTNGRELSNIASVDATTKATLESALQTGPNNFDYLNVTGISTFQNNVHLLDDDKLLLGGSSGSHDGLEIYHDANNSYIKDSGTGELRIDSSSIVIRDAAGTTGIATFTDTGAIVSGVTTISGTSHLRIPVGTTAQRYGSAVDGDIRYNSDLNSYEGYGNGAWGGLGGGTEIDQAVSSTSATNITTFAHADYRSASLRVQIVQGSSYQVGRYLLIHDGTTVTMIEESAVATGSMLGSISGSINGANLEIKVTMNSASSATVTTIIDKITV
jgi:hydrogenase maturation factor